MFTRKHYKICHNRECLNIEKFNKNGVDKFCPDCGFELKEISNWWNEERRYKMIVKMKENPKIKNPPKLTVKNINKASNQITGNAAGGALLGGLIFGKKGAMIGGLLGYEAEKQREMQLQREILEELKEQNRRLKEKDGQKKDL